MAEKKISGLPAAGAIDGTEEAPVVQAGVTKRATAANLGPPNISALVSKIPQVARKDVSQTFVGAQKTGITALTYAATIAINALLNNAFRVTLTAAGILGNPSGPVTAGMSWTVEIIQGGAGEFALTFASNYVGPASATGASPLDTTGDATGKIRLLSCYVISLTKIVVVDLGEAV